MITTPFAHLLTIDHYDQYRLTLKQIRNIQSSVQPSRDRKQKITDTIAHLKHKDPQSPRIVVLEQELVRAEAESLVAEAQLSNITREKLKAAFNYQFDAMREHSEKLALIAGYGKHLLDLIDDTPVTPGEARPAYDSYDISKQIIVDCENALSDWTLDTARVKSTVSIRKPKKRATVLRGEIGGDLSHQDKPLERESSLWVPASEHEKVFPIGKLWLISQKKGLVNGDEEEEEEEEEEGEEEEEEEEEPQGQSKPAEHIAIAS